jgi:hypothetical protein
METVMAMDSEWVPPLAKRQEQAAGAGTDRKQKALGRRQKNKHESFEPLRGPMVLVLL